jgi:hypothetical protein
MGTAGNCVRQTTPQITQSCHPYILGICGSQISWERNQETNYNFNFDSLVSTLQNLQMFISLCVVALKTKGPSKS